MELTTANREETLLLGERFSRCLKAGDIILIYGDLGAGKTTLTQGLCRGLGVTKSEYIRSPTFTLINEYTAGLPIYHIDLYRLDTYSEIEALGLEENLFSKGISIIEWPEKLYVKTNNTLGFGIDEHIEIRIIIEEKNQRTFQIKMKNQSQRSLPK